MALKQQRLREAREKLLRPHLEPDGTVKQVMPAQDYYYLILESIELFGVVLLHTFPHVNAALDGKNLLARARLLSVDRKEMIVVEVDESCKVLQSDLVFVKGLHSQVLTLAHVGLREDNVLHLMCVQRGRIERQPQKKTRNLKVYRYRKPIPRQQMVKLPKRKKV